MGIIESIYTEPEKWRQKNYFLEHVDGVKVWTSNGLFFYNTFPNGRVSFLWKLRVAKAHRWWTENQPVTKESETK